MDAIHNARRIRLVVDHETHNLVIRTRSEHNLDGLSVNGAATGLKKDDADDDHDQIQTTPLIVVFVGIHLGERP